MQEVQAASVAHSSDCCSAKPKTRQKNRTRTLEGNLHPETNPNLVVPVLVLTVTARVKVVTSNNTIAIVVRDRRNANNNNNTVNNTSNALNPKPYKPDKPYKPYKPYKH